MLFLAEKGKKQSVAFPCHYLDLNCNLQSLNCQQGNGKLVFGYGNVGPVNGNLCTKKKQQFLLLQANCFILPYIFFFSFCSLYLLISMLYTMNFIFYRAQCFCKQIPAFWRLLNLSTCADSKTNTKKNRQSHHSHSTLTVIN